MTQEGLRGVAGVAAAPFTAGPYKWANSTASTVPASTTPWLMFELFSNSTTAPARNGAVNITLSRYVATTTWDGNADTALKLQCNNNIACPAGVRVTALAYQARAYADCTKVCGVEGNSRVNVGITCPTVYGINHTVEVYGTVATAMYGMYMDMRNEGAVPTDSAGIKIHNSAASLATNIIGAAVQISKGAVNGGFEYLIDASSSDACNTALFKFYDDGTIANDTNATGAATPAGYLTVIVGTETRYIYLSSTAPTA